MILATLVTFTLFRPVTLPLDHPPTNPQVTFTVTQTSDTTIRSAA